MKLVTAPITHDVDASPERDPSADRIEAVEGSHPAFAEPFALPLRMPESAFIGSSRASASAASSRAGAEMPALITQPLVTATLVSRCFSGAADTRPFDLAATPDGNLPVPAAEVRVVAASPRAAQAVVEFDHPTLGRLRLELAMSGGRVEVGTQVSDAGAAFALRAGEAGLRASLAARGLELGTFRVRIAPPPHAERRERPRWRQFDTEA